MWAKVESDEVTELYPKPKSLTIGDTNYPRNIFELWTNAELKAINIYPVEIDNSNLKDIEYYINTDITYTAMATKVKGTYGSPTAKTLADVKERKTEEINNIARNLLDKYDWYTLRAADGGTAVPSAVTTYKAAVRTKSNTMCTAINNAADVDALAALYVYNSDDPPVRPLGEFPSEPS